MTVPYDRLVQMTRDIVLGKAKSEVVQTPEEEAAWRTLVPQIAAIREAGGIIDIPSDWPSMDHLAHLSNDEAEPGSSLLTEAPAARGWS